MIGEHIQWILYITGGITGVVVLQFLFPRLYAEKILKIELPNEVSRFYFAHWGLLVFCLAVLLVLAADNPALRQPVVAVTLLEKAILAIWVFSAAKKPWAKMFFPAAVFDTITSILYALFLLGM